MERLAPVSQTLEVAERREYDGGPCYHRGIETRTVTLLAAAAFAKVVDAATWMDLQPPPTERAA